MNFVTSLTLRKGIYIEEFDTSSNGDASLISLINVFRKKISKNRAIGELYGTVNDIPYNAGINLSKVSHKITSFIFDGDDIYVKGTLLDTPNGNIIKKNINNFMLHVIFYTTYIQTFICQYEHGYGKRLEIDIKDSIEQLGILNDI